MPDLRATFDEDAELYDRARPGYPAALYDELTVVAGLGPGRRVVEIGPGTGQATTALLDRGAQVTAVELGARLAARLRANTAGRPVRMVVGPFEDWAGPEEPVDLVAAFTAWHWLPPGLRTERAYAALRPGGVLATVTTSHVLGDESAFFAEAQRCYERWDPATPPDLRLQPVDEIPADEDEVDASDRFEPAQRTRFTQDIRYPTRSYLDVLRTYSGHRALAPHRRTGLLRDIADLIEHSYGGAITKRYLYELRIARRRAHSPPTS